MSTHHSPGDEGLHRRGGLRSVPTESYGPCEASLGVQGSKDFVAADNTPLAGGEQMSSSGRGERSMAAGGIGHECHDRPPVPPIHQAPRTKGLDILLSPLVRRLLAALWILFLVALSCGYARQRAAKRQRGSSVNPVSRHLDNEGLHHVVLLVSNLSQSLHFYADILGGQELDLGSKSGSDAENESAAWSMLNFGNSQLMLVEAVDDAVDASRRSQRFGLRLAASSKATEFVNASRERLRDFPELSAAVRCEVQMPEQAATMPPGSWAVAFCYGPDGELVELWQPSTQMAKALEQARKAWAASASDPRGRDLFE